MVKELSNIQSLIHEIRGQKVMFDSDLAALYEIETSALNRAVKEILNVSLTFLCFRYQKMNLIH